MARHDDMLICVQREWNGWRTAYVRMRDLEQVHWHQPSGAPVPIAHAFVSCAAIDSGTLLHDCEGSEAPHRLLVCALKRRSPRSVYDELARRADEHRAWARAPFPLHGSPAH